MTDEELSKKTNAELFEDLKLDWDYTQKDKLFWVSVLNLIDMKIKEAIADEKKGDS